MNLLFISNLYPDESTRYRGLDNAVLLTYLAPLCESIRAIALRPTPDPRLWRLDPFSQSHWRPRPEDAAFHPLYLPVPYIPKAGGFFNDHLIRRRLTPLLARLEKDFPFDTLLASWVFPDGCAVSALAAARKLPAVLIAQGSDIHQYLQSPPRRRKILRALAQSQGLITRSARLATLCEQAGADPAKLHPVYNGVDLEIFHPAEPQNLPALRKSLDLPERAPLILFVGNFLPVKNPHLLLQAFADLAALPSPSAEPPHLLLIGSGPLQKALETEAGSRGLRERVHFLGRKEPAQVADYMRAADCLALSSHNEGVPNVILESFASGLPLVSTDVGGIHEVCPEDEALAPVVRLVKPDDPPAFSKALAQVLQERQNTSLRHALAAHGRGYAWQNTARRYREILQNVPG